MSLHFVIALGDLQAVVTLRQHVEAFLREKLRLCLNPRSSHLRPVRDGVPFLGMRIYAAVIRPKAASWRRFRKRLRTVDTALSTGQITEEEAAKRLASQYAHAAHFNTYRLRTQDLARVAGARAASGSGADDRGREPRSTGGSYDNEADNARVANRSRNTPSNRNQNNGFRLAS